MEQKFYICEQCGSIMTMVKNSGVPMVCCGRKMTELIPGSIDASAEKHTPLWQVEGREVRVAVGRVLHPMTPEHSIEWVLLQTSQGIQYRCFAPGDTPEARFALCEGKVVEAVYAYCDLHGLWKA